VTGDAMTRPPLCVLTIAGSDSGAGAGIQADLRTIHALGAYAVVAVTAVTAQDTRRVAAWRPVPARLLEAQLRCVLDGFPVAAVKTGLLPGARAVRAVASALARRPELPLVVDPVLGSTSGTLFLSAAGVRSLRSSLLPRATLVTPNWPEASVLSGLPVRDRGEAECAARRIAIECGCAVLVKGGHARSGPCCDCLALAAGEVIWFEGPRIPTRNTHGTGCVLSAAIATGLALGDGIPAAVRRGRAFLRRGLRRGRTLAWGAGAGPAYPTA
jgi:hydroxymethylpyrimidine/phosphomethylpyrimidine kinase